MNALGRRIMNVVLVVENDGDGYHSYAPALKGLHMDGETEEEAYHNALVGVEMYIDSLIAHGQSLPLGPHFRVNASPSLPAIPDAVSTSLVQFEWSIRPVTPAN